jgi:hypothetical protein
MTDRNAEIWSTRLQKELLALTTDNATPQETQDVAGILPPFISIKDHELDIAAGICKVSFTIDISNPRAQTEEGSETIVITLDTSMERNEQGALIPGASAYPFKQPSIILKTGASMFPDSSTIENGDPVDIDCDWTPSLHMTDAVLNIGLKIKESILMGEPFHPAVAEESDPVDDLVKGARRFGNFLSKSARTFVTSPTAAAASSAEPAPPRGNPLRRKPKEPKRQASATSINIGDEINLMEPPWVDCQGLYSCKAIRRPGFLEDAIAFAANANKKNEVSSTGDDEEDDGEIPDNLGNYMRLQAGSLSKVCASSC